MEILLAGIVIASRAIGRRCTSLACVVALMLCAVPCGAADTETDVALWSGGLFRFARKDALDFSMEYQLRLDNDLSSLNSHFVEFMGYGKAFDSLELNGGYRFTVRPDHHEHRLYFGGFWNITKNWRSLPKDPMKRFKAVLQVGYQHDFHTKFDGEFMDSNSIRYVLIVAKPVSERVTPYLLGGVLTTWNEAYDFGIDKIRLGPGVVLRVNKKSRFRLAYIFEVSRFSDPKKHTNIFWIRYEMLFR
jgi:hypothetical protein